MKIATPPSKQEPPLVAAYNIKYDKYTNKFLINRSNTSGTLLNIEVATDQIMLFDPKERAIYLLSPKEKVVSEPGSISHILSQELYSEDGTGWKDFYEEGGYHKLSPILKLDLKEHGLQEYEVCFQGKTLGSCHTIYSAEPENGRIWVAHYDPMARRGNSTSQPYLIPHITQAYSYMEPSIPYEIDTLRLQNGAKIETFVIEASSGFDAKLFSNRYRSNLLSLQSLHLRESAKDARDFETYYIPTIGEISVYSRGNYLFTFKFTKLDHRNFDAVLKGALENEDYDLAKYALWQGADCNVTSDNGNFLHLLAKQNQESDSEFVKNLLTQNINVNFKDSGGNTVLMIASIYGNESIANQLISHDKIDVNVQNKSGQTALHLSMSFGRETVSQALLGNHETKIHLSDNLGFTPFALGVSHYGNSEKLLIEFINRGALDKEHYFSSEVYEVTEWKVSTMKNLKEACDKNAHNRHNPKIDLMNKPNTSCSVKEGWQVQQTSDHLNRSEL